MISWSSLTNWIDACWTKILYTIWRRSIYKHITTFIFSSYVRVHCMNDDVVCVVMRREIFWYRRKAQRLYVKCVFIFSCSSYISFFFFWKCHTDIFALEVELRDKKNSNYLTRVCLSYDTMLSWIFAHTHSVRNKWISYLKNRVYFQHKNINYCIYEIYVHAEACHEKWMTFVWKTRRLHDIPVLFS